LNNFDRVIKKIKGVVIIDNMMCIGVEYYRKGKTVTGQTHTGGVSQNFKDHCDQSHNKVGDIPVACPERPEMLGPLEHNLDHEYRQH